MNRFAATALVLIACFVVTAAGPADAYDYGKITFVNHTDKYAWVTTYEAKVWPYDWKIVKRELVCVAPGTKKIWFHDYGTSVKLTAEVKSSTTDCGGQTISAPYDVAKAGAGSGTMFLTANLRTNPTLGYSSWFERH